MSGDDSVQGTDESAGPGAARGQAGVEGRREHTCGAPVAMETPPPIDNLSNTPPWSRPSEGQLMGAERPRSP